MLWHDGGTLVAIPWIFYHVLTRSLGLRLSFSDQKRRRNTFGHETASDTSPKYTRRDLLILAGGSAASFAAGLVGKWLSPYVESKQVDITSSFRRGYFRIYTVTESLPSFQSTPWKLRIDGEVEKSLEMTFDQLKELPAKKVISDFHCVTGWSVYNVVWEGVQFVELMKRAGIKSEARYVHVYSADGVYFDSYRLEQLLSQDVLLAVTLDQKPLSDKQGAPCRLVVPNLYGYKSVKWVNRITLTKEREVGYWEKRGYDLEGYLKS